MKIIHAVKEMQNIAGLWQREGKSVGFVPTMGALHKGHLSLLRKARAENERVALSIFVNPAQFGPGEDYLRYPRPLQRDTNMAKSAGVDIVFNPKAGELYPEFFSTWVEAPALAKGLCGPFRPGHFRGVATIVAKLFNIVRPGRAYFGMKDYQQLKIIERMTSDLNFPVKIVPCPTVRESDGLAMSSRNAYLSQAQRATAAKIFETLQSGRSLIESNKLKSPENLISLLRRRLQNSGIRKIDYVAVAHPETLDDLKSLKKPLVIVIAVWIGKTRLIDNICLK